VGHGVTFRAAVGAVIVGQRGRVLACERSKRPDAWQLPQGGIDEGEEPRDALFREVEEETSIPPEKLELLAEHPEWLAYELPPERRGGKHGRGQVQKWFLLRYTGQDGDIDLDRATSHEFRAWRWQSLAELAEEVVEFRRPIYRRLLADFGTHLA
jgi:putative (di)nucleoside polyphosphate hydrolase